MKSLLLVLVLIPCTSFSETLLCVAEAGAVVEDGGERPATAGVADVSAQKFILTREDGELILKELGKSYVLFDKCTSEYFCERSEGYAGVFFRTEKGTFSITWILSQKNGRDQLIVAKGRCSTL